MKVSLNWLKDYVDITLPPEELAERLTMAGLEAGDVRVLGGEWDHIFIGEVLSLEKHPNADRLQLAKVSLGAEQHTVVCGAPNIAVGQRVAFARVGARLCNPYSGGVEQLKPAKIRGIRSEGMVCSEKELGLSDNHEGILVLAGDAPVGQPLADYMGDTVFDITVTPNRPDCLNMIGIAREVAALTGGDLRLPEVDYEETDPGAAELIKIEIEDPELCPRYCGGVISGVRIGPSPAWMQERLKAAGMRPINNIVDITNFVMLEYGQPLHAFDIERIGGRKIIVRRAREGERMMTLDGEERDLNPDMLLIADATHPVAIAGVMGGEESEVTEETDTILLESASFNNVSIRRTSRRLGLISEASSRFDKGLSPELPPEGIRRAIQLMVRLAGGRAARGIVDVYPGVRDRAPVKLTEEKVRRVLGLDIDISHIRQALERLGFKCRKAGARALTVTVPSWRTDVNIAEDLAEEVARIVGYDEIPVTMLNARVPHHEPAPLAETRDRIRDILTGCGMQEIISYSLTSREMMDRTGYRDQFGAPLRMANPLSRDQEFLRVSLRGGLLAALAANERHCDRGIMLFEVGKVYLPREGELPDERDILCGVIAGTRTGQSWVAPDGKLDFFYAKGILETLFSHLGLEADFEEADDGLLISGRTANIVIDGEVAGGIGELHPEAAAGFDLSSDPVCLFEMEIMKLVSSGEKLRAFQSIPRYPSISRDLALVVDTGLPARRVQDIICAFPQVREATVFDVYRGSQVPPGKQSIAFALRYQSPERTLTDEEVDRIQEKILARLEKEVGAVLRK